MVPGLLAPAAPGLAGGRGLGGQFLQPPRHDPQHGDHEKEGKLGHAGDHAHGKHGGAGDPEDARLREELLAEIAAEGFVGGGAGDDQASGDGDQQRRDHGDEAVAHGEHGVGLERVAEGNIELKDADQESGDDVDGGEQNGGERVTLAEAGGAVHGAVELGFAGDGLAAGAGLVFVDESGVEVGVDRHLLAGHGIEGEARRDLGGADRAVADDQELNGDERDEEHEADDVVAADDKLSEGRNDVAGGGGSFIAVEQDAARAGKVERQPEESEQQQEAGKDGELYRAKNADRREQDNDRGGNAHGQQKVEQKAGHGHQHDEDDRNGEGGNDPVEVGVLQKPGLAGFGHQEFLRACCWAFMRKM